MAVKAFDALQERLKQATRPVEPAKPSEPQYATFEDFWAAVLAISKSRDEIEPNETDKEVRLLGGVDQGEAKNCIRMLRHSGGNYFPNIEADAVRLGLRSAEKRYRRSLLLSGRTEMYSLRSFVFYTWNPKVKPEEAVNFAENCDLNTRGWSFAIHSLKEGSTANANSESAPFIRSLPGGREWWDAHAK